MPWLVLGVGLAVAGVIFFLLGRRQWFFQDDWDFLLTRGTIPGHDLGLWAPHGDHWSTLIILVYRTLFGLFGLTSYAPWAAVTVVVHLLVAVAMAVLLARCGAGRWVPVALGLVVGFMGSGAEAYLVDSSMNHTGALACGLAAAAVATRGLHQRSLVAVWVLLVLSVMWSGTGVTLVLFVVLFVALDQGARAGGRVLAVPLAGYLFWFLDRGGSGAQGVLPDRSLYLQVPHLVWRGLSNALDVTFVLQGGGGLAVFALIAVAVHRSHSPARLRHLALAGLGAALAQFFLVGISRIGFGEDVVLSSRYVYIAVVLLLPSVAVCCVLVARRSSSRAGAVLATLLVVAYCVNGVVGAQAFARGLQSVTLPWRDRVLGIVAAVDDGERPLTFASEDWLNEDLDPRLVVTPEVRAALPKTGPSPQGLIDAQASYFVGVAPEPFGVFPDTSAQGLTGFASGATGARCGRFEAPFGGAILTAHGPQGAQVWFMGPARSVKTQLVRGDLKSGIVRTWPVHATTRPAFVATTVPATELWVTFSDPGTYRICIR